jgi:prolyl-tRNA editing enzyme YbaK/EbsC (Cys-tRNA(Pro) deacylase)
MHGDCKVSTKNLARQIGAKSVEPCKPEVANRHSGYLVGGTSPFGTRKEMPVYIEESILALPRIAINGGRRGFWCRSPPGLCGAAGRQAGAVRAGTISASGRPWPAPPKPEKQQIPAACLGGQARIFS